MASPALHHERVTASGADPHRWAFLLAGIYGAGRNWNAVARRVVEARPEWGFIPVDLRGHGQSPPGDPPHTLAACVADLDALAATLPAAPEVIIGHSFGGKVALLYGAEPAHGILQTWVVDSTPDTREPSGSAWEMLRVLRDSPGPFQTREEGVEAVLAHGYARPVAQWMTTNLVPEGELFRWRLDPDQMEALLRDFFRTDAWPAVEGAHGPEIHLIKATESSILDEEACHRVEAAGMGSGRTHLHEIQGGHWLNADNPEAVVELLAERLPA